jgi:hypothetical protein
MDHSQHELKPLLFVLSCLKAQSFIQWPSISVILDFVSYFSVSSEFNFTS